MGVGLTGIVEFLWRFELFDVLYCILLIDVLGGLTIFEVSLSILLFILFSLLFLLLFLSSNFLYFLALFNLLYLSFSHSFL